MTVSRRVAAAFSAEICALPNRFRILSYAGTFGVRGLVTALQMLAPEKIPSFDAKFPQPAIRGAQALQ